ncbi:MAG TPA: hypothetical protein VJC12_02925 [Candidatus Paceibacterota bacterium]
MNLLRNLILLVFGKLQIRIPKFHLWYKNLLDRIDVYEVGLTGEGTPFAKQMEIQEREGIKRINPFFVWLLQEYIHICRNEKQMRIRRVMIKSGLIREESEETGFSQRSSGEWFGAEAFVRDPLEVEDNPVT